MENNQKSQGSSLPLTGETEGVSFYAIDYIANSFDTEPKLVPDGVFVELLMRRPQTQVDVQSVRHGVEQAKRYLPAVVWGGHFKNRRRRQDEVIPSGLFCTDIDHVGTSPDEVRQYYAEHFQGREDELGIVFAHISPSGTGLHVVALCQEGCETIPQCQARLAAESQTEFDPVCKDLGRIFYLSTHEDILYNDLTDSPPTPLL